MQAKAQLRHAQADLERTRIVSPVDGYVTNLQAQLGDFANAGANTISVVDANSSWVDGSFEETNLAPIRVDDPTLSKLMGHSRFLRVTSKVLARSRRQHRSRHERCERATRHARGRECQPDLHVGAPRPAHPGPHSYRRDPIGRRSQPA
jgi:HlyD family secretion protein